MVARRKPRIPGTGGTFAPGHRRVGGRKKGTPNRSTRALKDAVMMAAEQTGEDGRGHDGLLGYLRMLARTEPRTFTTLLVKAIPMEIAGDADRPVVVTLDPAAVERLSDDRQEVLRDVLRAIASGTTAVAALAGTDRPPANPSRYAGMLRPDTATSGRA